MRCSVSTLSSVRGFLPLGWTVGILAIAGGPLAAAPVDNQTRQTTQTCIAIVLPSVQGVEGDATDMGSAVCQVLSSFLKGPSILVVELEARLVSQALIEAQQKQCGHVLVTTLTRKRGGGGALGRVLGGAAGSAAVYIPGGATVGSAVVRGAVWGAAQAAASLAATTKKKDEMRLEYRLSSPGGTAELGPKTDKRNAKADGEDLLTPLAEKTAEAIVAYVTKS